jgi:hypothetical protein
VTDSATSPRLAVRERAPKGHTEPSRARTCRVRLPVPVGMSSSSHPQPKYLQPPRERRRRRGIHHGFLVLLLLALLLAVALFVSRTPASGSQRDCEHGEISAIGPVDEQGRGQTTPDVRCLEP